MIEQQTRSETFKLTATHEGGSVQHHELEANQSVFIGSSSNCGFRLSGKGLSDIHCYIAIKNRTLIVQDWMSSEGTRVNGELIETQLEVSPGDVIEIGPHQISIAITSEDPREPVAIKTEVACSRADLKSNCDVIVDMPSSSQANVSAVAPQDSESSEAFDFDAEFFDIVEEGDVLTARR